MTTTTIPVTTAPAFSAGVAGVLSMLRGSGDGALKLDARTEAGIGHQELHVADLSPEVLPLGLMTLLEERQDWYVTVRPAILDGGPPRLCAIVARFLIEPVFGSYDWAIPQDQVDDVARRLEVFPHPPSAIIDGVREIAALWRLEEALPLGSDAQLARVSDLQLRLARVLGAATEPEAHLSFIPLCGRVREMGASSLHYVQIPVLDLGRTYPLDEFERAMEEK